MNGGRRYGGDMGKEIEGARKDEIGEMGREVEGERGRKEDWGGVKGVRRGNGKEV